MFSYFSASTTTGAKKESAVLTDASMSILGRELGPEQGLMFLMNLNLPTTRIVNACNCVSDQGLIGASDQRKTELTTQLLLEWRSLKGAAKEKDKVRDLERAFKEMGKTEHADMIMEKHTSRTELTSDAFANLQ